MVADGGRATVLVHQHEHGPRSDEQMNGVRVIRARIFGRLLFTPLAPTFALELQRALQTEPSVIHMQMPNPSAFWCLFSRRARKLPWIVHWQSDVIDQQASLALKLAYYLYRPFEQALLRRAEVIVTASPHYAAHSPALARHQDKVRVIPIGIEDLQLPQAEKPPQAPLQLLTVGRLTYYKGHEYLLRALALLAAEGGLPSGRDVHWQVVGSGEEQEKLAQLTQQQGLTTQIDWCGKLDDAALRQAFAACDLFVLPSIERTEAFGVVLLEAMRLGKLCIVTDVPGSGMNWIVEHGVTGLVVQRMNAAALAAAIKEIDAHPEQAAVLGENARQRFLQVFQREQMQRQWLEVYGRL